MEPAMLVTAWWFPCPDPLRAEGLRLGVPASVSSLSGVCKSISHGQHSFRQAWAKVALRRLLLLFPGLSLHLRGPWLTEEAPRTL